MSEKKAASAKPETLHTDQVRDELEEAPAAGVPVRIAAKAGSLPSDGL